MNYTKTEERLIEAMENMMIIDAHEHLPPEHVRTNSKVDVMTLFCHYTRTDLITSGMSPDDYNKVIDPEQPLDERWKMFKPYFEHIRYASYTRPALIAAKEFYGFDDITDDNYREISERMQSQNTPGIYHRIMREKCKIRVALTQAGRTDYEGDLLIPIMPIDVYGVVRNADDVKNKASNLGMEAKTFDDYLAVVKKGIEKWKSERVVGIKMISRPNIVPSKKIAEEIFNKIMNGENPNVSIGQDDHLTDFLWNYIMDVVGELDMVIAVHAGMWGDFRYLDSKHNIAIFPRHPNTRFDLYHLGMPSVRDTIVIGKNFANVWLNLCWCHIISQQMTCSGLDECIDMVPINKILGFGGDYGRPVEKIYGHLVMAREDIATVLGRRVDREQMSVDEAVVIANKWLWENPKNLYKLNISNYQ
jgi:predicted TIM-barrel fold metal-dependent hydrolase